MFVKPKNGFDLPSVCLKPSTVGWVTYWAKGNGGIEKGTRRILASLGVRLPITDLRFLN
jgi:hypothetical protein